MNWPSTMPGSPPIAAFRLRIGINAGDVIVDNRDIYGNSVNIAARLEGLAEPGEIYVAGASGINCTAIPTSCLRTEGSER